MNFTYAYLNIFQCRLTYTFRFLGEKINFGRAYIGSHEHSTKSGFVQWEEMAARPNTLIIRNHFLDNYPDIDRK